MAKNKFGEPDDKHRFTDFGETELPGSHDNDDEKWHNLSYEDPHVQRSMKAVRFGWTSPYHEQMSFGSERNYGEKEITVAVYEDLTVSFDFEERSNRAGNGFRTTCFDLPRAVVKEMIKVMSRVRHRNKIPDRIGVDKRGLKALDNLLDLMEKVHSFEFERWITKNKGAVDDALLDSVEEFEMAFQHLNDRLHTFKMNNPLIRKLVKQREKEKWKKFEEE